MTICTVRLLLVCIFTAMGTASVAAQQVPQGSRVLEDRLTAHAMLVKGVVGGQFTAEGWTVLAETDHLYYELPDATLSGSVEFEVKGTIVGAPGDARKHIVTISDRYLGPTAYHNSTNSTVVTLRIWSSDRGPSKAGKTRLRTVGPAYEGIKNTTRFQKDSEPLVWDSNRWYRVRVRWTQEEAVFERDGQVISTVSFPNRKVEFRHLLLNTGSYGQDMHGLVGVTFRNLRVTSSGGTVVARSE